MDGCPHLRIGYRLRGEFQMNKVGGLVSLLGTIRSGVGGTNISMAECEGLGLVTLVRNENG